MIYFLCVKQQQHGREVGSGHHLLPGAQSSRMKNMTSANTNTNNVAPVATAWGASVGALDGHFPGILYNTMLSS